MPDVQTLAERLADDGWRMTAQRRVIVDVVDRAIAEHLHPTADHIHERAVSILPETSRATVYNTLGELVERGHLVTIVFDDRVTRYDAPPTVRDSRHDHLICTSCGAIRDVPASSAIEASVPAAEGFAVTSVDIVYRGVCRGCADGVSDRAATTDAEGDITAEDRRRTPTAARLPRPVAAPSPRAR